MKRLLIAALATATSLFAAPASADLPGVNVLVTQEDWDGDSLPRNNRIQIAVLNTLNQTLHSPAYQSQLKKYGISGMDVYDESALTVDFYGADRVRRSDEELISLARTINNPEMDVIVPYTFYARAVTDPYTNIVKLQMSLNYRAMSVRDSRWLGGDNLDIDTAGVPFTGCAAGLNGTAADPHCVREFVATNGEKLARNAANKLAIQLAGTLGRTLGGSASAGSAGDNNAAISGGSNGTVQLDGCGNIPTTFKIEYIGFEPSQMNNIEAQMNTWKCALDTDMTDSDFSQITFSYKTRADKARVMRNIRLMLELMGQVAEPRTEGANGIVVEAFGIREN